MPEPLDYATSGPPKQSPLPGRIALILALLFMVNIEYVVLFGRFKHAFQMRKLLSWNFPATFPLFALGCLFSGGSLLKREARTSAAWIAFVVFAIVFTLKCASGDLLH